MIGPGGVYLVDSKFFVGSTSIHGDVPVVRRYEDPDLRYVAEEVPRRVKSQAAWCSDRLRTTTRMRTWVQPVVALWGEFEAVIQEADGVTYLRGSDLAEWLLRRPPDLQPQQITRLWNAVDDALIRVDAQQDQAADTRLAAGPHR